MSRTAPDSAGTNGRRWRAALCAFVLCIAAPRALAGGGEVQSILARLDARDPAALESGARALAALGPKAMGEIFGAIGNRADTNADRVLAHAFACLPAAETHGFVEANFTLALASERRTAALLVLREAGGAGELARACDLAAEPDAELVAALVLALQEILRREPAAMQRACDLALQRPLHVAEALIDALSTLANHEAARALLELGAAAPVLATSAFSHLSAAAGAIPRPAGSEFLERLRELLSDEDAPAAEELLLLAGRFEDDEAVPLLIARLSSTQPGPRSAALWSLRRITGFDLGKEGESWSAWFAEESRWWSTRSAAVLAALHQRDASVQCNALADLGQRFWRRQRVADELCAYLGGDEPGPACAAMACGILGRLRCASARAALEARAADAAPALRAAAEAALRSLDGKKVPARSVALPRRRAGAAER